MPDLPTITVTQAQADRILLAFGGDQATAVPAYKRWLGETLRDHVLRKTVGDQNIINSTALQSLIESTSAALPPPQ